MYSFYGGKQGRTYNIVARYDELYINFNDYSSLATTAYSAGDQFKLNDKLYKVLEGFTSTSDTAIPENALSNGTLIEIQGMVNKFQQGGSYTDVNYGQYVIIDTILNKNHYSDELNGLLYRRGFDYNEAATQATRPRKDDKDQHDNWIYYYHEDPQDPQSPLIFNTPLWTANWRKYVENPGGGAIYIGQIVGPQGDAPELHGITWSELASLSTSASIDLDSVSGKELNKIQFGWTTLKDSDGNVTGANIAFNIPYTVQQMQLSNTDPYSEPGVVESLASSGQNFYYKWDWTIPSGKKGDSISNIGITTAEGQDQKFYYTSVSYATSPSVESTAQIAPYRVIKNISSMPLPTPGKEYFSWVVASTGDPPTTAALGWATTATNEISEINYTLICTKAGTVQKTLPTTVLENGYIIKDDDHPEYAQWMVCNYIQEIENPQNGLLNISYTAGENDTASFRQIDSYVTDYYGNIYVTYSDESIYTLHNIGKYKSINNVIFNNRLDGNQKFQISYVDENIQPQQISQKYNTVLAIDRIGDNLIILYSDPEYRHTVLGDLTNLNDKFYLLSKADMTTKMTKGKYQIPGWGSSGQGIIADYIDENGTYGPVNTEYFVWTNFGALGSQYHVFGDYTEAQVITDLPEGFPGTSDRAGWIISVTTTAEGQDNTIQYNKAMYAYDYHNENQIVGNEYIGNTKWFKMKDLTDSTLKPELSVYLGTSAQSYGLNENGLAFIVENTNHIHSS